jgi:hypothetical protein
MEVKSAVNDWINRTLATWLATSLILGSIAVKNYTDFFSLFCTSIIIVPLLFLHHWYLLGSSFQQNTVTLVCRWSLMNCQHLSHSRSQKFDNCLLLFFMHVTGVAWWSMVAEQSGWNTWGSLDALHLNGQKSHPLKYKHLAHNFLFALHYYFEEMRCAWLKLSYILCMFYINIILLC